MAASKYIALVIYALIRGILAVPALTGGAKSLVLPAIYDKQFVRNSASDLPKIRAKYRRNSPHADSELGKRQDSTVVANYVAGLYTTPVSIGGTQVLNLHPDTGSGDLWVFSTSLPSGDQQGHNVYDPSRSASFLPLTGSTFDVKYGDGSTASGSAGTDTVAIGTTVVQNQAFGLASQISASLRGAPDDGILGLGFSTLNSLKPPLPTFFENAQASLQSPIFAAYLPYQANGAFDFGAIDTTKYTGTLKYAPVNNVNGYWQFDSMSYMVGGEEISAPGVVGIADIGSGFLLMQDEQLANYYAAVPGANDDSGEWEFPCNAALPILRFLIGPTEYANIAPQYLIYEATDNTRTTCVGVIQSRGTEAFNVYGTPLFNAYYGVFDTSVPQFGFAPCQGCIAPI